MDVAGHTAANAPILLPHPNFIELNRIYVRNASTNLKKSMKSTVPSPLRS